MKKTYRNNEFCYYYLSDEDIENFEALVDMGIMLKIYDEDLDKFTYDLTDEGLELVVNLLLKYTGRNN